MNEEANFITLTNIPNFSLRGISPVAVAFSYPLLAVATSSSAIVTYNFRTKETSHLKRADAHSGNMILCSAVSSDCTTIVTGHSDGEIVFWSIALKSSVFAQKMDDPISFVTFALDSSTIVFATPNGSVFCSVLSSYFFRKTLSSELIQDFGVPITCLCSRKKYVFVSSCDGTVCLDASNDFNVVFSDCETAVCYAFYKTMFIARGVDHDVVLTDFSGKNRRVFNFSQTPSSISVVSPNTVIVLYNGFCEMCVGDRRFTKAVPTGRSLAHKGKIFIASNNELLQITIASISERVKTYAMEGNWNVALSLIKDPNDANDINGVLDSYINSASFEPLYLFKTVERLKMTFYVTELMMPNKFEEILQCFAITKPKWVLTLQFIEAIDKVVKDDKVIHDFLESIEMNINWIPRVIAICLKRSFFDLADHFAADDIYLALKIAEYTKNSQLMHQRLSVLKEWDPKYSEVFRFLIDANLTIFLAFDSISANEIIELALQIGCDIRADVDAVVNNIIRHLDLESIVWVTIADFIDKMHVAVTQMDAITNYIKNGSGEARTKILHYMIHSGQLKDYENYLYVARDSQLGDCELEIITLLQNTNELVTYLINHKSTSFADNLRKVAGDKFQKELANHADILFRINPDEFTAEVTTMQDKDIQNAIIEKMSSNWHFMKRVFTFDSFIETANESYLLQFLEMMCAYTPDKVIGFVWQARNLPLNKAIGITEKAGVLGATLYLCLLLNDFEKASNLTKFALQDELMEKNWQPAKDISILLSSYSAAVELWSSALSAFELPLAAKIEGIIPVLVSFVQSLVSVVDIVEISQKLVKLLSFVPFSEARPVFRAFFDASKEKAMFGTAFAQIRLNEAIANNLDNVNKMTRGVLIHAEKCSSCRKSLSGHVVSCGQCGRSYHCSCVHGWCENCSRVLHYHFEVDEPALRRLQKFETLEQGELRKAAPIQKPKKEKIQPLPNPTIGIQATKL